MKAEEKAKEIFVKFLELIPDHVIKDNGEAGEIAKRQSMTAIDEILDEIGLPFTENHVERLDYWQEVKQHLLTLNQ